MKFSFLDVNTSFSFQHYTNTGWIQQRGRILRNIIRNFYPQIWFPDHYHPQCSCGKVMFSQASVILFEGGPLADTLLGRHPPGQTPSWADTPQTDTLVGRHPQADSPLTDTPGQTPHLCAGNSRNRQPPQGTATAADGTRPTGMHSCLILVNIILAFASLSLKKRGIFTDRKGR